MLHCVVFASSPPGCAAPASKVLRFTNRYPQLRIASNTPSLITTSPGLSSQKSDFEYSEYGMFETYWPATTSTIPISMLHCITTCRSSRRTVRSREPADMPKATNAAHGKNPKLLKLGTKYARTSQGRAFGSIEETSGESTAITTPKTAHSLIRSNVLNTAMGASIKAASPIAFKISTLNNSLTGLPG